ncbi:hypothetical protein J4U00_gp109 [Mycobacterium phage DyoEdafos]|uniref:Uncharacterized protein n=1 Tax=Mycobacterium phage DyoEdafos TaxID=2599860 RepID=A0A5J6TIB5_9CAUD|nr:hypothetical protein J4U00_gp109 [Mycobacterium phage DyoEdafos]QFG10336.1 hypothetical protein SEA_DYOEDAFOS_109 [Mycobacterium phage DyoEdafos]
MSNPWGPLPTVQEAERAVQFTGWAYEGGYDTALEIYREKYGDEPNFAVDSPDGGLLNALAFLKRALALLPNTREGQATVDVLGY